MNDGSYIVSKRSPILNRWTRRLTATAAVMPLALAGLGLGSLASAQADTARPSTLASPSPVPVPVDITSEVSASTVAETQQLLSGVLAANNASSVWPEVAADLTPKLDDAVAAGGGDVMTTVLGLGIKVIITCTFTAPPPRIECTVEIQIGPANPPVPPPDLENPFPIPPMSPVPRIPVPEPDPVPSKRPAPSE